MLQALLAHLLTACGDERGTVLDADELAERFSIPREELQETLSLLNLVNFGGGCYTVYAEVDEETGRVRVDKELYGDVFRRAPKLTPLEARAIRLAIEYVGPTIAADAHTPLARVRRKLEETFGQFELAPAAADGRATTRKRSSARSRTARRSGGSWSSSTSRKARRSRPPASSSRTRSSGSCPFWRVHTWDRTVDGPRTYRLDRMRSATLTGERFESREGFDPNYLSEPATAVLWHSPAIARWKLERGARALTDKAALSDVTFKTEEWLLSEVLADRGETVVLEPTAMRRAVASRARALQSDLGLGARKKTAGRA